MTRPEATAEKFGHGLLGPIVAEFCLRLWSLGSLLERPAETSMLFCARGGLRMQLAYDRFLAASELAAPVAISSTDGVAARRGPAGARPRHRGRGPAGSDPA